MMAQFKQIGGFVAIVKEGCECYTPTQEQCGFPTYGHTNAKLACDVDAAEDLKSSQPIQRLGENTAMDNTDKVQAWLMAIVGLVCLYSSGQMGAGYTALVSAGCALGVGFKLGRSYREA